MAKGNRRQSRLIPLFLIAIAAFGLFKIVGYRPSPRPPVTPEQILAERAEAATKMEIADREMIEQRSTLDRRRCEDKAMALVMAQNFVKESLISPASADFQSYSSASISSTPECIHTILSYVDSENAFGSNVRAEFKAVIQYVGSDRWSLLSLEM